MQSFGAAGFTIIVLKIFGWLSIMIGGIYILAGLSSGSTIGIGGGIFAGIGAFIGGVLQIGVAQIGEAAVVAAENSRKILAALDGGRLPVSTSVSSRSTSYSPGSGSYAPSGVSPRADNVIKRYKGRLLMRGDGGVKVEGEDQVFANVLEAERFVDGR